MVLHDHFGDLTTLEEVDDKLHELERNGALSDQIYDAAERRRRYISSADGELSSYADVFIIY